MTEKQGLEIANLLKEKIRRKLANYNPETNNMPFHTRLLGKDRMAIFSFVHSLSTNLGSSIFEQVAAIIARSQFTTVEHQYKDLGCSISREAQRMIQEIIDDLTTARIAPNKSIETRKILSVVDIGERSSVKRPRIDLFIRDKGGQEFYFDLKTAKPNIGEFKGFKRNLLEWIAIRGAENPKVKISTMLAIPYNPYEPEPYQRWTLQGLFDLPNEILVADEFWDFLGGKGTYIQLLGIFEKVGIELRPEIDQKFSSLK